VQNAPEVVREVGVNDFRAYHQPQNRQGAGITVPLALLARADEVIE
jgi:hypothetical protein